MLKNGGAECHQLCKLLSWDSGKQRENDHDGDRERGRRARGWASQGEGANVANANNWGEGYRGYCCIFFKIFEEFQYK